MKYFATILEIEHYDLTISIPVYIKSNKEPTAKDVINTEFPDSSIAWCNLTNIYEVDNHINVSHKEDYLFEITEEEYNILVKYK